MSPNLAKFFATFFFVGLVPFAPGTFGSFFGGLILYYSYSSFSFYDLQYLVYGVFLIGIFSCHIYCSKFYKSDPKEVVIDEVFGMWVALAICKFFIPWVQQLPLFISVFLLFRFFDILKPFPISYIDKKMKNALGVMLDDGIAGIFTGALTSFGFLLYDRFY